MLNIVIEVCVKMMDVWCLVMVVCGEVLFEVVKDVSWLFVV